jgi:fructokinase
VIVVAGEVLVDLVVRADGVVDARLGGGPYNTARTLARLGAPTTFFGGLADDRFGRLLRGALDAEGVAIGVPGPSAAPTTLALVDLDQSGVASYAFYLTGTAAADLDYPPLAAAFAAILAEARAADDVDATGTDAAAADAAAADAAAADAAAADSVDDDATGWRGVGPAAVAVGTGDSAAVAVHVGALGLVMEPIGSAVERLVLTDVPPDALVMLDPNCRPGAIADRAAYLGRIGRIAARADVVKASVDDLDYLYPGSSAAEAAELLLAGGSALVLVTDGPRPARAFLPGAVLAVEVPAVEVVDTIGAGDAFGGGFLAWWSSNGLTRSDLKRPSLVRTAVQAGAAVAAATCGRPGADPPTLADLQASHAWPSPGAHP